MKSFILLFCAAASLFAAAEKNTVFGWASPWSKNFPSEQEISVLTHLVIYPVYAKSAKGEFYCEFSDTEVDSMVNMAKRHGVKVLISFGAGNMKIGTFMAEDPTFQGRMASYLCDFVEKHKLDGVDNAWEVVYVSGDTTEEETYKELKMMRQGFNTLGKAVHDSLDSRFGKGNKEFTVTTSCMNKMWFSNPKYQADSKIYVPGFWDDADYVMLMTYQDDLGKDHSTLENAKSQVKEWMKEGMPKEKMVIGFNLFAQYAWEDQKIGKKTVPAIKSYSEIIAENPALTPDQNTVTYSYPDSLGKMVDAVYGFNGVNLVKAKMHYADTANLAGILFWELGEDLPMDHPLSLLRAVKSFKEGTAVSHSRSVRTPVVTTAGNTLILSESFSEKPFTMSIFSCMGRAVKTLDYRAGTSRITIPDIASGVWMIRLRNSSCETVFSMPIY